MASQKQAMTVEAFDEWAFLPENRDTRLEYIDGEIIEVTSNAFSSEVAAWILWLLGNFVHPRKMGHLTGEGAGYMVGGARVSPDVAFVSKARQEKLSKRGWNPVAPDLAVEVVSPTDEKGEIEKKQRIYREAGVWHWHAARVPGQGGEGRDAAL
jgi:Uma2 family endonuclease